MPVDFYGDPLVMQEALGRFAAGEDSRSHRWLGCHPLPGQGYVFRLWAPAAAAVSLVGDHNGWDPAAQPMERLGQGVWECACQHIPAYTPYKYHILYEDGQAVEVTDPFAVCTEDGPGDAGLACGIGGFSWQGDERVAAGGPLNVYRVGAGSWRRYADGRPYDFAMLTEQLVPYAAEMGYTHLLLDGVIGQAPLAPDSRLGTPHDLMALVAACHDSGLGVLLEWRLPPAADPASPAAESLWKSAGVYWLEEYHLDGLLVTGSLPGDEGSPSASFWIAWTAALRQAVPTAHLLLERDVSPTATLPTWEGGLGFSRALERAWAADTACYTALPGSHREEYPRLLTASLGRATSRRYLLPLMPEAGAYPVEGMPGTYGEKLAAMRVLLGYQMAHPGGKLHYMGTEFGQFKAWDPAGTPDWLLLDYEEHRMMRHYCRTLNRLYCDTPALWEQDDGLYRPGDEDVTDVLGFCRPSRSGQPLVAVCNFRSTPLEGYAVGLPVGGRWVTVFSSDLAEFGGAGRGFGSVTAADTPLHGQPCSASLTLPPLSVLFLQPAED